MISWIAEMVCFFCVNEINNEMSGSDTTIIV